MNLFILDYDLTENAKFHANSHVVKILTESAQVCSSALRFLGDCPENLLYSESHSRHPICLWARNPGNLLWTANYSRALYFEYLHRYNNPKNFVRAQKIFDHVINNYKGERTDFCQCMPDEYKRTCAVEAYRAYYKGEKQKLFAWKNREKPAWI